MSALTSTKLPPYDRLSRNVCLHPPPEPVQSRPADHPSTVLLFSWMNGTLPQLRSYIRNYHTIYPHTPILSVLSTSLDFLLPLPSRFSASLSPAITHLTSHPGPVLLHAFSNGGAMWGHQFLTLYKSRTHIPLPLAAVIFDSAPGIGTVHAATYAMTVEIKNKIIRGIAYAVIAWGWCWYKLIWVVLMRRKDLVTLLRERWNDQGVVRKEVGRCYMYSEGDKMVWRSWVETHADEAERRGWRVRKEEFGRSGHVLHAREDGGRYWRVVGEVWEDGYKRIKEKEEGREAAEGVRKRAGRRASVEKMVEAEGI